MDDETTPAVDRRAVLGLGAIAMTASAGGADAAPPGEIMQMDARALVQAIRARKVSCVELMTACLDRIEAVNPHANAIVGLQPRQALLKEAAARDAELAGGEAVGPLHGLPHAVKDLAPVKGLPFTHGGAPIYRDTIAATDNLPVERMRKAGVVFIGKTNAPEFGLGSHTTNPVWGPTRNAYDPTKSAGGSSGGAAVALAHRMLPVADGSDYGGSLRNPAGWNNVCGFRTSYGRVPVDANDVWLPSMGVTGPMARNVADLALLLSVQAGWDARVPLSMDGDGAVFRGPLAAPPKGLRVGWLGDFGGQVPHDPGVLDVCGQALKRMQTMGARVDTVSPNFPVERAWQAFIQLRAWQQSQQTLPLFRDPKTRAQLNPQAIFECETAAGLSGQQIAEASVVRSQWSHAVQRLFATHDVLIAPTAQLFPFEVGLRWPTEVGGMSMRTYHEWMKGVCLVTLAGCPSLAMPAGFSAAGLPMGIQIIAPVHQEVTALRVGAAYEAIEPLWKQAPRSA
jgi:amidase